MRIRSGRALGGSVVAVTNPVVAEGIVVEGIVVEGTARAQTRPSRQPKRVPPLRVVVRHAQPHGAIAGAPRPRTAGSGGTHERLSHRASSVLALRARQGRFPGSVPLRERQTAHIGHAADAMRESCLSKMVDGQTTAA